MEQGVLLTRCLVAVDEATGRLCHVQWLTQGYNDGIRAAAALPALSLDEVLLESAYTPPAYRRLGIMAAVTAMSAELAAKRGLRYALAFIERDNVASLRGARSAGLVPWQIETQRQYGFGLVRRARFAPVPAGFRLPHDDARPADDRRADDGPARP